MSPEEGLRHTRTVGRKEGILSWKRKRRLYVHITSMRTENVANGWPTSSPKESSSPLIQGLSNNAKYAICKLNGCSNPTRVNYFT